MLKTNLPRDEAPTDPEVDADLRELFRVQPREAAPQALRAYGYIRKSKLDKELPEHSLPSQAKRIQECAAAHGWPIEDQNIYADAGVSGRLAQRPALHALKQCIRTHQVDVLIVDRVDRLFRSLFDLLEFIKFLNDHQVRLISVRENIDYSHAWGKLVLYILGVLAEFYSNVLSEEMRLLREHQAAQGRLSSTYRFGYCNGRCTHCTDPNGPGYCPYAGGPDRHNGAFRIPHPVEAIAVRLAYEWYAAGELSDADIARQLNAEPCIWEDGARLTLRTKGRPGVYKQPEAKSLTWEPEAADSLPDAMPSDSEPPELRYPPGEFDRDAVRAILTNPVYAGYVLYYGTYQGGKSKKGELLMGKKRHAATEFYPGKHEALVPLALYRKVQKLRGNREHRTTGLRQPARTFPLTGILHCQEQASPLRGISSNGGKSRYYVDKLCKDRLPRAAWHQPNLRADRLEAQVTEWVGQMQLPAEWQQRILAYVVYDEGLVDIEQEKFAVRQRLARAQQLHELGDYTLKRYNQVKAECQRRLTALAPTATESGQEAQLLLDNLPALWASLTPDELKSLYTLIFDVIYVNDAGIAEVVPHEAFQPLLADILPPAA